LGIDYYILAPREGAQAAAAAGGARHPTTSLGSFRSIYDWITSHAPEWHPREPDGIAIPVGEDTYAVLHLSTERRFGPRLAGESFVPRDDENIVEIYIHIRGEGPADYSLLAQLASHLKAVIFCGATSAVLSPQAWLQRSLGLES
jgi:hypothetical protein